MQAEKRLRILALSRNYPSSALPRLGLWARNLMRLAARFAEVKVIAPVPWCPPIPGLSEDYVRYREVPRRVEDGGIEVFHPRIVIPPGHMLHAWESVPYRLSVAPLAKRLRRTFPFDLIHAHFVFPDGYVAAQLGRQLGVPVVLTEHASWRPWMDNYPAIRRRALWTVRHTAQILAVSQSLAEGIESVAGKLAHLRIVPNVVDGDVFTLAPDSAVAAPYRILFVGIMRKVKGLDVLFHALRKLRDRGRDVELAIVGESHYPGYQKDLEELQGTLSELGLNDSIKFLGPLTQAQVAVEMQRSALLVLPSRRETFGTVLAEALACGIPVVATRCGGTEDVVSGEVGILVPVEDPEALANGIEQVLAGRASYAPHRLREYSLSRYGSEVITAQLADAYREAMSVEVGKNAQKISRLT